MQDTKYKLISQHAFYSLAKYKTLNAGHQIQIDIKTNWQMQACLEMDTVRRYSCCGGSFKSECSSVNMRREK
jgi:hypothetical protein